MCFQREQGLASQSASALCALSLVMNADAINSPARSGESRLTGTNGLQQRSDGQPARLTCLQTHTWPRKPRRLLLEFWHPGLISAAPNVKKLMTGMLLNADTQISEGRPRAPLQGPWQRHRHHWYGPASARSLVPNSDPGTKVLARTTFPETPEGNSKPDSTNPWKSAPRGNHWRWSDLCLYRLQNHGGSVIQQDIVTLWSHLLI